MASCRGKENISLPNCIKNKRKTDNILLIDDNIPDTGWALKDGNLIFMLDNKQHMVCNESYTHFQSPNIINDNDNICPKLLSNGGILYRKKDSHELWWKTNFVNYNLTPNINSNIPERIYDQKVSVITDNFEFTGKKTGIKYSIYPIGIDFYVNDKNIMKIYDREIEKGISISGKINITPTDDEIMKFNNYGIFKINDVLRIGTKHSGIDINQDFVSISNLSTNSLSTNNLSTNSLKIDNGILVKRDNDLYWVSDKEYKLNLNLSEYQNAQDTGFNDNIAKNHECNYNITEVTELINQNTTAKINDMLNSPQFDGFVKEIVDKKIYDNEVLHKSNMSDSNSHAIPKLKFKAGCNIKKGDILCINDELVYKSFGGRIDYLNSIENEYKLISTNMFSSNVNSMNSNNPNANSNIIICNSYYSETDIYNTITIFSQLGEKINEYNYTISHDNNILFSKFIHYENETAYLLYYIKGETKLTLCKISGIFAFPFVRQILEIEINNECESLEAVYDKINNLIMIVGYTLNNFVVVLVNNGDLLEIGTIDNSISNIIITENKKLNILIIPGGTALISYGYSKTIIMYGMYNMIITSGETIMDYQSTDCISMLYNNKTGIITTVDKTISNYTYIQNFELFGTSIHKISSKLLIDTPEPLACSYNDIYDCYLLSYKQHSICYKYIYIDDKINVGISFNSIEALHVNLLNFYDCFFICLHFANNTHIYKFINHYNGNPIDYIGIADNNANIGEEVNITTKGEKFYYETSNNWIGKKIYLSDTYQDYPNNLSINNGILIGMCLCKGVIYIY